MQVFTRELLKEWQVVHLCGKGNLDASLSGLEGYVQYEYISAQLKDLFAMSDLMVSRAGANSICELLALRKPNILIPLSAAASRGDQILNAESFRNTEQKFNAGAATAVDYNVAKNNLLAAQSLMLQARYEYIFKMKILDFYRGVEITL